MNFRGFIVVIPAYNEAKSIASVVNSLRNIGVEEILVVDDGSADNTFNVVNDLNVHVLKHPINLGQGAALRTGFKWVLQKNKYNYILAVDADGQHLAKDVEMVAKKIFDGFDIVKGRRTLHLSSTPFSRVVINFLADIFTGLISGKYVKDTQSGLHCIDVEALKLLDLKSSGYSIMSEIIIEAVRNNLSLETVEIDAVYTKHTLAKGQQISNSLEIVRRLLS